jgi:DNA-binding MarR family transcriptional regulator
MSLKFTGRAEASVDHEILDLLFGMMESFKTYFVAALESVELPLSQGHVLMCLDEPTPMHALATRMGFDASHITAIVDRLEERSLIERRPDPHDRRVRRVALTDAGVELRERIRDSLFDTLPPLSQLSVTQRRQLRDLLAIATRAAN